MFLCSINTSDHSLYKQSNIPFTTMTIRDFGKWNARVSIVYAIGVWTMLGSLGYMKYTGRLDVPPPPAKKEEEEEPKNPNQVVYETAHSKSTIIYKEGFVPYTTRIYNFIKSFSGEEPGTGHDK